LAAATALAGCSGSDSASPKSDHAVKAAAVVPLAAVTIAPSDGAAKVRLDKAVKVQVAQGKLAAVEVRTKKGKVLKGSLSADQATWTSQSKLAADTTYLVSVEAAARNGRKTTKSASFSTLTPKRTASASIQPIDGWTVGIGMPVIVNFSKSVKNRTAVEQALTVSSTPAVEGSWHWFSSHEVQWRPKEFWPGNTKVKVTADLSGVEVARGVWGEPQKHSSKFKVGASVVNTVDVNAHTLTMRRNGKVVRVIPVTTGKAAMATRNGIKVIMSRETEHRMDSASIGIQKGDPGYYNILARYAMRLTYSGEFLHAAPWSTGSQGRANVSHGCTGMSTADAKWLFNQSKVGDVVVFKGSKRKLEWGNGYTAWNMTYAKWQRT
jgi:lipoprotein-anchoring transpeptidase ErfK/SrfK